MTVPLANCVRIVGDGGATIGSGVLLTPRTVLTAWHVSTGKTAVVEWSPNLAGTREVHGRWASRCRESDLGLIHLDEALNVPRVRIADSREFLTFQDAVFVGFSPHAGQTGQRMIALDVLTRDCGEAERTQHSCILGRSFVARVKESSHRLCLGDSGGPMLGTSNGEQVIAGILLQRAVRYLPLHLRMMRTLSEFMQSTELCEPSGVFARLDLVTTWIEQNTK